MAAASFGSFGDYKYKHYQDTRKQLQDHLANHQTQQARPEHESVWVQLRYTPLDPRSEAPVPRHKIVLPDARRFELPRSLSHWVPQPEAPLKSFIRDHESGTTFASQPSTRDEHWSTLRESMPSRGTVMRKNPLNWGTGLGDVESRCSSVQGRFPHINSPMTRYTDAMHKTNKLFSLY